MRTLRHSLLTSGTLTIFISLISVQPAYCDLPIVDIDPSEVPGGEEHGNGMVGWTFNLQQPLTITAVGWYDDGKDGLSRRFQVGLWQDLTGYFEPGSTPAQLLGSPTHGITIPAGTTASLQGSWRVVPLPTPVNLLPGNYELGGLDTAATPDVIKFVLTQRGFPIPPTSPGMTIQAFFYAFTASASTFQVVDNRHFYLANGLELGAMLFTNVPEPSTLALVSLGAAALIIARRRT